MDTRKIEKAIREIDRLTTERDAAEKLLHVLSGDMIEARPSEGHETAFEIVSTNGSFGFDNELMTSMALATSMKEHLRGRIMNLGTFIEVQRRAIEREVSLS